MSNLKLAYHGDALADAIDCEFAWMKEMTTSGVFVAPAAMDNASQSVHSFETYAFGTGRTLTKCR